VSGILAAMKPRVIIMSLSLSALFAGGTGCVTAKKYEALEGELAKTRGELSKSQGEVQSLSTALATAEAEISQLDTRIAELEQELAQRVAELEEKVALAETRATDAETQLAEALSDRSKLKASVEEMTLALAELKRQRAQAEARLAVYRSVLAKFKDMIDNGKLKVKVVDGRMVLQLQTDILFSSGSAKLSDVGEATVQEVGKLLSEIPDRRFQVEGHTDNVPINTKTYPSNWELASARAINVTTAMVAAGMPASRLSAASFADTRPTHKNDTEEGRAQNRRIEIVLVPDLSDLPGAEDIEKMFKSST
jgi:chemotaxis protein MotB